MDLEDGGSPSPAGGCCLGSAMAASGWPLSALTPSSGRRRRRPARDRTSSRGVGAGAQLARGHQGRRRREVDWGAARLRNRVMRANRNESEGLLGLGNWVGLHLHWVSRQIWQKWSFLKSSAQNRLTLKRFHKLTPSYDAHIWGVTPDRTVLSGIERQARDNNKWLNLLMIDTGYIYPGGVVSDRWHRYGNSTIEGSGHAQDGTVGSGGRFPGVGT
jgi:hypothetical protein